MAIEHLLNYSKFQYAKHRFLPFPQNKYNLWNNIELRLMNGEPIQYITGLANFYDLQFYVNPDVLIPRQETEELVHLILSENNFQKIKLLDIGTGCGCIAISLKKNRSDWKIFATDISASALNIASKNAEFNNVKVNFIQDDICNSTVFNSDKKFDIIVSNPPYIPENEMDKIHKNIKNFEPHSALFSPDKNPLKFYKHIANFASEHLIKSGTLYVEINEKFAAETSSLFKNIGLNYTEIINDINEKPRIIRICP